MLNNLLESKAQKQRSTGGAVGSFVFHVAVAIFAIQATLNAGQKEKVKEEKIDFVETKKDEPPPPKDEPKPPPPEAVADAPTVKGFQVLTAPVNIPDVLPEIDLSKKLTNESDFSGKIFVDTFWHTSGQGCLAVFDGSFEVTRTQIRI